MFQMFNALFIVTDTLKVSFSVFNPIIIDVLLLFDIKSPFFLDVPYNYEHKHKKSTKKSTVNQNIM